MLIKSFEDGMYETGNDLKDNYLWIACTKHQEVQFENPNTAEETFTLIGDQSLCREIIVGVSNNLFNKPSALGLGSPDQQILAQGNYELSDIEWITMFNFWNFYPEVFTSPLVPLSPSTVADSICYYYSSKAWLSHDRKDPFFPDVYLADTGMSNIIMSTLAPPIKREFMLLEFLGIRFLYEYPKGQISMTKKADIVIEAFSEKSLNEFYGKKKEIESVMKKK